MTWSEYSSAFEILCHSFSDAIAVFDDKGKILLANPSFRELFGRAGNETEGENISNIYSDSRAYSEHQEIWSSLSESGEESSLRMKCVDSDGRAFPMNATVKRIDQIGTICFLCVLRKDVKRTEISNEPAERFRLLEKAEKAAHVGRWTYDIIDHRLIWSDEVYRIHGLDPQDINLSLERSISAFHADDQETIDQAIATLIGQGDPFELELRVVRPDGQVRHVSVTGEADSPRGRLATLVFGSMHDITEAREVEEKHLEAREKLEAANRLKSAFLANMSHEIRTPLNGIMGLTQLLCSGVPDPEERKSYLNLIQANGDHLLGVVNNVLDMAQLETHQLNLKLSDFDLHRMLLELYSVFEAKTNSNPESQVSLILDNDIRDYRSMRSDETRLRQILHNLLANAVKFTNEGAINFGYAELEENRIRFYVKDTGIGVAEELKETIFERFRQVDSDLTRQYDGCGLGLAICKGLSDLMGGKLWVDSDGEMGSTFNFEITLKAGNGSSRLGRSLVAASASLSKRSSVLIIDESNVDFVLLKDLVSAKGLGVCRALDGDQAVDRIQEDSNIGLVIVDIKLPKMDGYEITRQIKERWPGLPVVAKTAYTFKSDIARALRSGCDDILSKPVAPTDLNRILAERLVEQETAN